MGANEIANRVEASAWIAAAGQSDDEGVGGPITPADFFFRSLSGFVNKMEILGIIPGQTWDDLEQVSIALFLDRNYARRDTTMLLQPIETFRPATNDPSIVQPVSYEGPLRVIPVSAEGFESVKGGGVPPFTLPASVDPYSVLVVVANLMEFQQLGHGLEFGIEVLRMPDNDGPPTATEILLPIPPPP